MWLSKDPKKLAYQIHEALLAASPEELNFETYAKLRENWIIRYKKDRVIAEKANAPPSADGVLSFEGVFDPLDIVQIVIKHRQTEFAFAFPDANKEPTEMEVIENWCKENDYNCAPSGAGILIHKQYASTQTN